MPSTAPTLIRLADYRPPQFLIDTVALSFRLAAAETQVAATLELRRNPAATRGVQYFLSRALDVSPA